MSKHVTNNNANGVLHEAASSWQQNKCTYPSHIGLHCTLNFFWNIKTPHGHRVLSLLLIRDAQPSLSADQYDTRDLAKRNPRVYKKILIYWYFDFIYLLIIKPTRCTNGDRDSTVVKVLCCKSLVRSQLGVSGLFIDIKSFLSHYGPGVDSASNRNEYQEYLLGVKAAGA